MFQQKMIKNIFLAITLFLLHYSTATAQYEQIAFATGVSSFDVWNKDKLLLGDASGKLTLFTMSTGQELSFCNEGERIVSLTKIPGQRRAIVSFASGMVALFRYDGKILKRERIIISSCAQHFAVTTIQISPDGKFAILHGDRFTRKSEFSEIWDLEQNRMTFKFSKTFHSNASVITLDSGYVIVSNEHGLISWHRLSDGNLSYWIDVNYTFGQRSKKGFIGYKDIINLAFQNNQPVLTITTSGGKILKIDLSRHLKLVHQSSMKLGDMHSFDSMMPLQIDNGGDFFIGSHSLFFENKLFLFDSKKWKIITCSTSASIKTIKIINENLPITLLEDGTLIGWTFNCLLKDSGKFVFDHDLEEEFGRLGLI